MIYERENLGYKFSNIVWSTPNKNPLSVDCCVIKGWFSTCNGYVVSIDGMTMKDKLWNEWEAAAVSYFNMLFH
jgi:hypothetical protein